MDDDTMASDPTTDPAQLHILSYEPALRRLVAANPNASRDDLLRLAFFCPDEVATNSVLPLLFLEDPAFYQQYHDEMSRQ